MIEFRLLDGLRRLERVDNSLCFSTHPSDLEWQLQTGQGVRLLGLHHDDLAAPRTEVLFFALQTYLGRLGVTVSVDFPRTDSPSASGVGVTAVLGERTLKVRAPNPAMALLEIALLILESNHQLRHAIHQPLNAPPFDLSRALESTSPATQHVEVLCANRTLRVALERQLQPLAANFETLPTLFVDASGHRATHRLANGAEGVVVMTDNPCQEYWLDVLAVNPAGFLAGDIAPEHITQAFEAVARGQQVRHHPCCDSPLWPKERTVLRLVAEGLEPEEVSAQLKIRRSVVRNYVASITMKLRLARGLVFTTRIQLANYYWGNFREPGEVSRQ